MAHVYSDFRVRKNNNIKLRFKNRDFHVFM